MSGQLQKSGNDNQLLITQELADTEDASDDAQLV